MDLPIALGIDLEIFAKLGIALLLSLPLALNREAAQRAAGLRTFTLVAVTACGFCLIGERFLENINANARLMQGVIGGLGFLGGGAILKHQGEVQGLATAAAIWSSGVIGVACAYGEWEVGFVLMVVNFAVLWVGKKLKRTLNGEDEDPRPNVD